MTLAPLGDRAVVLALDGDPEAPDVGRARALASALAQAPPAGVVEVVPAFASVTVFYDPVRIADFATLCAAITTVARGAATPWFPVERPVVEIPVCYGGEFGPDLPAVAAHAGLAADAVVALHSDAAYDVEAVGFLPGFAYLGGLPERLHTPRRATPRPRVPAGAVGIGGARTGVYPVASPGGWNLIGRTPLSLFAAERAVPARLQAGDRVRFRPISRETFDAWG